MTCLRLLYRHQLFVEMVRKQQQGNPDQEAEKSAVNGRLVHRAKPAELPVYHGHTSASDHS